MTFENPSEDPQVRCDLLAPSTLIALEDFARWLPTRTFLPMAPAICGLAMSGANCITIAESPVICTSTLSPLPLV